MFRPYISSAVGGIFIKNVLFGKHRNILCKLGFHKYEDCKNSYAISCSEKEMIKLFQILNDNGFAFSDGRDWNPADLYEYYREKGLLKGKFRKISWFDGLPICYWK